MTVNLRGTGFTPDAPVEAYLASTPVLIGSTLADASGVASLSVTIPSGYEGTHSLVLFEPSTGLIQRQMVEIIDTVLPATGTSSPPVTLIFALVALLAGLALLRRPSMSTHRTGD
jgi:LPXTG-motif cell wall-anchored protein